MRDSYGLPFYNRYMSPSPRITIATANTQWGQALQEADSLKSLKDADVLLLQEAINVRDQEVVAQLSRHGFSIVHAAERFGLAIALRDSSSLALDPRSLRERRLQKMGLIERQLTQRSSGRSHGYREHGMIAAKFKTSDGQVLTIVNVHPTVPVKSVDRRAQIRKLSQELRDDYYIGPLIVAGDMNHFYGPTAVDRRMHAESDLRSVDLNNEPTWYARGSGQEKYLKISAFIFRRPIEYYNGYHDIILYRGATLQTVLTKVVDIQSDHRAVIARFMVLSGKTT